MRVHRRPGTPTATGVALAIGTFDGVHRGHAALIERARSEAAARGLASAALTFEPQPREYFAPREAPGRITSLYEKLAEFARLGLDHAFVQRFDDAFCGLDPADFARHLRERLGARRVVVGEDFRFGAKRAGDVDRLAQLGRKLGFEVGTLPTVLNDGVRVSSSRVREALVAGDFGAAARLLGRPYAMAGRVVHGAKRGRVLGFPTANVRLGRNRPVMTGVFAVKCHGAATRGLEGVASLGYNPAVQDGGPATLEAFLFDFQGDLYGRHLSVEFQRKLRDEAAFASLDELAAQIRRDCDAAREHFRAPANR